MRRYQRISNQMLCISVLFFTTTSTTADRVPVGKYGTRSSSQERVTPSRKFNRWKIQPSDRSYVHRALKENNRRRPRQFSTQLAMISVWFAYQRNSRATKAANVLGETPIKNDIKNH